MAIPTSVKNNAQSREAAPVSAYFPIAVSDFGVLAPGATGTAFGNGNLTAGSAGSLATTTGAVKITWVTAIGESTASAEGTVSVTGATGSISVALGSVGSLNTGAQLNAQPILGWRIYSGSGSGNELLNTGTASDLSVTMTSITLADGTAMTYIPIATTTAVVKVYGAGAGVPVVNTSGIQPALPAVAANTSADVLVKVPAGFSVSRKVQFKSPNDVASAAGVDLLRADCVAPIWVASTAFSAGDFVIISGFIFQAIVAGTTASTPPAFPLTKYSTVVDSGVTWKNLGRGKIVRLRFLNATGAAVQPTANEYDLYQL